MKKSSAFIVSMLLCLGALVGCSAQPSQSSPPPTPPSSQAPSQPQSAPQPVTVRVAALKGPTGMGLVGLMNQAEAGNAQGDYDLSIVAAIDEITPKLVQGEVDIAAVPANLSSVLYNNTQGQVRVLAVNTLGVIYIVETGDSLQSMEDLRGKTIYASGKGATPEYALNYLLSANGIDPAEDVTIEYRSEHAEVVAALAQQQSAIAMLPQPFVTTAQMKDDRLRIALDLTEEWDKVQASQPNPGALLTGVMVARSQFIDEHPEQVKTFLAEYAQSVEYVNANVDEAAELIEKYDIFPAAVARVALPYCNIVCITGDGLKNNLSGYLKVLFEQNPQSIGGALPDEAFYYSE
jgi:NitT/TauT family transport system substrate-binding protein